MLGSFYALLLVPDAEHLLSRHLFKNALESVGDC